MSQMQCGWNFN